MSTRQFGDTGLVVPALGLGGGPLGEGALDEGEVERLIHAALDLGVTLIDTARSYGASEERIGRALRGRRERAVLSTKVGYGVAGVADWSGEAVRRGIDEALVKLGTPWIDIVHLHSCGAEVLRAGEAAGALLDAVAAGKVRVAAYSGENQDLDMAVASGAFGSVQLSLNPWDQGAVDRVLWRAKDRGLGAIAKRALGNAWWRHATRPEREDIAEYWRRGRALGWRADRLDPAALALRFAVFTWGIDCAIVGTTRLSHLKELVAMVEDGPLPAEIERELRETWRRVGNEWPGLI